MTTDRPDDRADEQIEAAAKVLLEHRLQYDNTGGFRGVLGGWNRACTCGWHGVDEEFDDHSFEHHVAGLLVSLADQDNAADQVTANAVCHLLGERLRRAEAEVQRLRTERDCINGERMTFLTQRDQLRAQVAAVEKLAVAWRNMPHPEGAESMSDWIYRMHVNSLGAILERTLDTAGGEQR